MDFVLPNFISIGEMSPLRGEKKRKIAPMSLKVLALRLRWMVISTNPLSQ